MIASTPEAMKLLIWSSCLATSFCASSICTSMAVLVGIGLDAVAQHGQEVVVEQRHRHADVLGHGGGRQERGEARGCN
jgi:hypothetical protein